MNGDELIFSGPMTQLETDRWIQNMEDHMKNTLLQDAANATLRSENLRETVCDAIIANGDV